MTAQDGRYRNEAVRAADRHANPAPAAEGLRVRAAWGLPGLLQESGVPLAAVLQQAGLPDTLFEDGENRISYRQLEALFLACEQRTGCGHFGLLVGQRSRLRDMGVAGQVAFCEPTAAAGLRSFIEYFNLHDTAATCVLEDAGHFVRFVYSVVAPGVQDTRHFQFGGITIACNILQDLCGPDWAPTEVRFATRAPAKLRPFQQFFRAPVHFDQGVSAVVFRRQWLDRPLPAVDEGLRHAAHSAARAELERLRSDFPALVRRLLRKQLLQGQFGMDDVARLLSMHRRTLDRRLQKQGLQYGQLLESVREDIARQLLRDTTMPIQRIAEWVRFSSAANFTTAFRHRTGMTPSAYRRGG